MNPEPLQSGTSTLDPEQEVTTVSEPFCEDLPLPYPTVAPKQDRPHLPDLNGSPQKNETKKGFYVSARQNEALLSRKRKHLKDTTCVKNF